MKRPSVTQDGYTRLIEAAFPLRQVSLDSVHEKNVRHGHISTLHIWPARRPLAASRAALLATLLPDPGSREGRRELLERMAGSVVVRSDENGGTREATAGGILRWGRDQEDEFEREVAAGRSHHSPPPSQLQTAAARRVAAGWRGRYLVKRRMPEH